MADREPLERAVLDVLWEAVEPVTASDVAERLSGRRRAATTILTALDRLRRKGLVERTTSSRPHRWQATGSREQVAAEAILAVLSDSADRGMVLSRFVADADEADVEHLRRALRSRAPEASGRAGAAR